MTSESVRKSNNPSSLGEWLESNVDIPENAINAVVWPKDYESARSIDQDTGIFAVTAIDDTEPCEAFEMLGNVRQKKLLSYELAESTPGKIDLEYSWAVADDTVQRGPGEGLSVEEGMHRVAETSEEMLRPGGVAVYNLDAAGGREELPYDSQMDFARTFEDILEENYDTKPDIYEAPEMRDSNTHLVWKKPK